AGGTARFDLRSEPRHADLQSGSRPGIRAPSLALLGAAQFQPARGRMGDSAGRPSRGAGGPVRLGAAGAGGPGIGGQAPGGRAPRRVPAYDVRPFPVAPPARRRARRPPMRPIVVAPAASAAAGASSAAADTGSSAR